MLLNILKRIATKNLQYNSEHEIKKSPTPLNMHQGSVVTLPAIDLAMAVMDGSRIKTPDDNLIVKMVGKYHLWDYDVYHCYVDDNGSFIRITTKANNMEPIEAQYFIVDGVIEPKTIEDWELWLGSWQKDSDGEFVRDSKGIAIKKDWGLIGFPQFQVNGDNPIVYDRQWLQSTDPVEAVKFTEVISTSDGDKTSIKHEAMEYARTMLNSKEYLLVSVVEDNDTASVTVFIGVELDHKLIKVLVS